MLRPVRRLCLLAYAAAVIAHTPMALAQSVMWVGSDVLNRRTCPSTECGVVGRYFFREQVDVLELKDGWARVTKTYNAACENGVSVYVDKGNAACVPENGIVQGEFSEWVSVEFLVGVQPPDPGAGAEGTAKLVANSDDFKRYKDAFVKAAETLMAKGQCTAQEFLNEGGWIKSVTPSQRDQPIYFTYCKGGMDRIYLNAETGKVWR